MTERVALLGWPVEHSVSPAMHNAAFAAAGLDWRYELMPAPPGRVFEAVKRLRSGGFRGANVTVPHKVAVAGWLDEIEPEASAIGAVNTIARRNDRLIGSNTDAAGFARHLNAKGFDPAGKRALVLGAGGGARAVVVALARAGCAVTLGNRSPHRAKALVQELAWLSACAPMDWVPELSALDAEALGSLDLVVNCTPVGMWPGEDVSPWPIDWAIQPHWTVYDLVYNPTETRLLAQARAAGARALGGLGMLVWQGALAYQGWTGLPAPYEIMEEAACRALRDTAARSPSHSAESEGDG